MSTREENYHQERRKREFFCGRQVADSERMMQESFELRNKVIDFTLLCETSASISRTLRELREKGRKLFCGFVKHY